MAEGVGAKPYAPVLLSFTTNLATALVAFVVGAAALLHSNIVDPTLHTVLDTSVALTGALIALLLWDMSRRSGETLSLLLAIAFAFLTLEETLHVLAVLGWLGGGVGADVHLRAGTWGPAAQLLPVAVGGALLLRHRPRSTAWPFALALALLAILLTAFFLTAPRYTAPGFLWITRPTLLLVPPFWAAVGWAYWRRRDQSELARAVALSAIILTLTHGVMLYSRAPSDTIAMVAHLGKVIGDALLLFNLTQIGAADTARRRQAEHELMEINRDLDARVAAREAERRGSLRLIEAIIDNSPAVIYVKDLDGRYLMVNQRFADIFHVDKAGMPGRTDHDLFSSDVADAFRDMDKRVVRASKPLTAEETVPEDDGLHTYISVKSPLRDDTGEVHAIFGISTDITEQRRIELALLASEQRNRLIVESALDAVVTIDGSGTITGWNPQAEAIFGWPRSEALGRSVEETIMPEQFRSAHRDGLVRYLATGEARVLNKRIELTALRRSGEEFPAELSITPMRAGEETSFSAFLRDITDRKLAQARLQAQHDRLHLLEQITRAISQRQDVRSIFQVVVRRLEDGLPADFACICDYDRVEHVFNVAHVGVKSAPLGRELGIVERAKVPIDRNGLSRSAAGELVYEPDIAEVDFPFPSRLAREGLRSLVIAPLAIEEVVFGVLIVARRQPESFGSTDCEFLKQLAEHVALAANQTQLRDSLQQAYDDLKQTQQAVLEQERLRAIGQMASGIAHDINNAISPIAVYTQTLLERERKLAPAIRNYLELVGRVVTDVAATVGRMRDFYRSDREAALEPWDINDIVPQVIELTRARWSDMPQQRGVVIEVSTDLAADLPPVMANPAELREVLTNLIFNAVDAMPDGGTITVRTAMFPPESGGAPHVRLEVGDTGAGMDAPTRERCLDPFFTTKGERGTGLGLAMVQAAAQRHQATLGIDSAPGDGTRVWLDFATAAPVGERAKPAALRKNRPLRLLVVDDDPAVLLSNVYVLEISGHAVTTADGGQAGIDALRAARSAGTDFDAVITDLGMPYVDGNKVAEVAKELFPETPIILLTGWGRQMASGGDLPPHVDFTLSKPLNLGELREVFAEIG